VKIGAEEAGSPSCGIWCLGKVLFGVCFSMMGDDFVVDKLRAVWRTSFSSSLSWESKSMKSTPGKRGMKDSSSGKSATQEV